MGGTPYGPQAVPPALSAADFSAAVSAITSAFGDPTRRAIDLPVRHDELVLGLLKRAIELLPPEQAAAMAEEVGAEYGRAMGSSLSPADAPRSLRAALTTVADALSAHGFAAHAEGRGEALSIVADHCPFGPAAVTSPVLCALERGVVKGMLAAMYGTTDARTARSRARGDATCVTAVVG